jgi:hypothetical protein
MTRVDAFDAVALIAFMVAAFVVPGMLVAL